MHHDKDLNWSQKLYRIMKDGEPVSMHAGPGNAAHEIEKMLGDMKSRQNIPSRIDQLRENEECDLGNGVVCRRLRDISAPVIDPMKEARKN